MFGKRLKERRTAMGYTQTQLGDMIGVTHACICYLEKGKRHASMPMATVLANALGCSVSWLFNGDE